jgi:hypothetical protein
MTIPENEKACDQFSQNVIEVNKDIRPLIHHRASSAIQQAHGPEWPIVKARSHNRQPKGGVACRRQIVFPPARGHG